MIFSEESNPDQQPEKTKKKGRYDADRVNVIYKKGSEKVVCEGNAYFKNEDGKEVYADRIVIMGENYDYASMEGNVTIIDSEEETEIGGVTAEYNKKKDYFLVKDNAYFIDLGEELLVKGSYIENYDKEKVAIVQGNVRIYKKDIFALGEIVKYSEIDKIIEISGFPVIYKEGNEYRAKKIKLNTETEDIVLEGNVSGEFIAEDEEDEKKTESTNNNNNVSTDDTETESINNNNN